MTKKVEDTRITQKDVHRYAVEKGWYPKPKSLFERICTAFIEYAIRKGWYKKPKSVPEHLCLIHSEISEALEEFRKPFFSNDRFAEEMADAVIRIMDLCEWMGIDLDTAIYKKHRVNLSRPHRHGGKKI